MPTPTEARKDAGKKKFREILYQRNAEDTLLQQLKTDGQLLAEKYMAVQNISLICINITAVLPGQRPDNCRDMHSWYICAQRRSLFPNEWHRGSARLVRRFVEFHSWAPMLLGYFPKRVCKTLLALSRGSSRTKKQFPDMSRHFLHILSKHPVQVYQDITKIEEARKNDELSQVLS